MILIGGQRIDLIFLVALSLVLIFVFYLLMMITLSQFRKSTWFPRQVTDEGGTRYEVVFVIPCLNEESVLGASIERLVSIDYPRTSVLVVDDGSDDRTAEVVRSFDDPRVHLLQRTLPNARKGKGQALNAAIRHILTGKVIGAPDLDATIIVVVDADGRMDERSLEYVLPRFDDAELGGVQIGVRINNRHTNLLARFQDLEFVLYTEVFQRGRVHLGSSGLGGNGQFVRLSALTTLGEDPWSDSLTEDLDLGVRLLIEGLRLDFCPDVAVHQQGLVSLKRWIRQRTRWFQGHLQSWSLLPDILTRLSGTRRIDVYYHLTSPFVLLMGSLFTVAFFLWFVDLMVDLYQGTTFFSWYWLSTYFFTFGPAMLLSLIYRRSERSLGVFRTLLLAHLFVPYSLLWMIAGWRAVARILLGKKGWAKTERLKENADGVADGTVDPELPESSPVGEVRT
ncbi:glycosyltransferase [Corynebacterium sp. YIM 101645]|uniref:Glycosyltransferase n=1 Tax=Corynebacterium lemuris TaxID=1859292 RepID=A0ABT2FZ12_9CORY|nr:glycosyltransferase family 2 protein [Corynebacterium lemuris]MCS5479272.1 glycosyltransferase [Corynebacterium lemuris]